MFNVYYFKNWDTEHKELIASKSTKKEAWECVKKHYGKDIPYSRIIIAAPNEHQYDVGSHIHFYSIENTEGDMPL